MIIKEGKAKEVIISTGLLEPVGVQDANVIVHDSGLVEIKGNPIDPNMHVFAHLINCEIIWNFTDINIPVTPSPDGSSVTPFRRKK